MTENSEDFPNFDLGFEPPDVDELAQDIDAAGQLIESLDGRVRADLAGQVADVRQGLIAADMAVRRPLEAEIEEVRRGIRDLQQTVELSLANELGGLFEEAGSLPFDLPTISQAGDAAIGRPQRPPEPFDPVADWEACMARTGGDTAICGDAPALSFGPPPGEGPSELPPEMLPPSTPGPPPNGQPAGPSIAEQIRQCCEFLARHGVECSAPPADDADLCAEQIASGICTEATPEQQEALTAALSDFLHDRGEFPADELQACLPGFEVVEDTETKVCQVRPPGQGALPAGQRVVKRLSAAELDDVVQGRIDPDKLCGLPPRPRPSIQFGTYHGCDSLQPATFAEMGPGELMQNMASQFGLVSGALVKPLTGIVEGLEDFFKHWLTGSQCGSARVIALQLSTWLLRILQQWLGDPLQKVRVPAEYQTNFDCPVNLPTAEQATSAYLANAIDLPTLECLVRANDQIWQQWEPLVNANRSRLTVNDLVSLWRRGLLPDDELADRVRQLGYLRPEEVEEFKRLSVQIPFVTDLTRFMVRDTFDEALVDRFQMDEDFERKFTGRAESWAKAQGVEDDYMRMVWRSHWRLPSPTQLYAMLHRLRPGKVDPSIATTIDDVRTALKQDDVLPWWIDRLAAVSYRPLNRVDIRRFFRTGVIDRNQVKEAYLDLGYDDANAEIQAEFADINRRLGWLRSKWIGRYAMGDLGPSELVQILREEGAFESDLQPAIDRGNLLIEARRRKACVKAVQEATVEGLMEPEESVSTLTEQGLGPEQAAALEEAWRCERIIRDRKQRLKVCLASLRKRYLQAEFSPAEAEQEVRNQGVTALRAKELVAGWHCELEAAGKLVPATQICRWLQDGLIAPGDAFDRLRKLGYDPTTASTLLRECRLRLSEKLQKEQERAAKDALREQRRKLREAKAAEREAQSERDKMARLQKQAQAAREKTKRELMEAATNMAKRTGQPAGEWLRFIRRLYRQAPRTGVWTPQAILEAVVRVSQLPDVDDTASFSFQLADILRTSNGFPDGPQLLSR